MAKCKLMKKRSENNDIMYNLAGIKEIMKYQLIMWHHHRKRSWRIGGVISGIIASENNRNHPRHIRM